MKQQYGLQEIAGGQWMLLQVQGQRVHVHCSGLRWYRMPVCLEINKAIKLHARHGLWISSHECPGENAQGTCASASSAEGTSASCTAH
eukprot:CAMPEP_0174358882 /NCGR_PEP_ID=MMETSP0811_2-20130205/45176_1 /TAXON_ID=73025 ORGANISM="Eutreptiella gymnastica-like, Strain CCMP1594" /NCGR_SAMPLE_ID=MMETSP0811_2 /ASSEMBLY_ACC=CAM_ASM_000667 /LENGTH=87 /DNA_ID=CAMNT_0015493041 /DNA_START=62 /DNA_END=325 /DNA_ORIENTATION=+